MSAGRYHTCGVKTDGTVACWGRNDLGQATPPGGTFTQVSAGGYHTCGVKTDGTVACWGDNFSGQAPNVSISPTLPNGALGAAYSQVIPISGGAAPYSFSLTSGALPPGLSMAGDGTISGTPTTFGDSTFAVQGLDATGLLGTSQNIQITVQYGSSTGVVADLNPSVYGYSVTFTATVSATPAGATGTVTFTDGATPICTAVALSNRPGVMQYLDAYRWVS